MGTTGGKGEIGGHGLEGPLGPKGYRGMQGTKGAKGDSGLIGPPGDDVCWNIKLFHINIYDFAHIIIDCRV